MAESLKLYWQPIATAPVDADLELSVYDNDEYHALVFPCRREATVLPRPTPMGDNMVEILKFSRETAFTPETIQILAAALDEAWERLRQSGSRLAKPAYSRAMREVVAKRIIEMAQRGVEDREALVTDALRFIAANYEQPSKLTS
jgi:hypothetical protein